MESQEGAENQESGLSEPSTVGVQIQTDTIPGTAKKHRRREGCCDRGSTHFRNMVKGECHAALSLSLPKALLCLFHNEGN